MQTVTRKEDGEPTWRRRARGLAAELTPAPINLPPGIRSPQYSSQLSVLGQRETPLSVHLTGSWRRRRSTQQPDDWALILSICRSWLSLAEDEGGVRILPGTCRGTPRRLVPNISASFCPRVRCFFHLLLVESISCIGRELTTQSGSAAVPVVVVGQWLLDAGRRAVVSSLSVTVEPLMKVYLPPAD